MTEEMIDAELNQNDGDNFNFNNYESMNNNSLPNLPVEEIVETQMKLYKLDIDKISFKGIDRFQKNNILRNLFFNVLWNTTLSLPEFENFDDLLIVTEYLLKKINVGPNSIYESGHLYLDSLKNNKNEFEAFNVDAHSRGNKEDDEKDIPDVSLYLISRKKELYSLLNNYIISFISKESNTKKIFENDIMIIRLENILSDRDLFKSFCELIYKEYQKNFREIIRIFQKLFEKLFSTYLEHTMIFINAIIKITPVQ